MLDQLLKIVEENAQQPIVNNQAIPNQFNQAAIKEVGNQILNNLKGQVNQGNMQQVIALFQSGGGKNVGQHPVVDSIVQSVSNSLASKFTLPGDVARQAASGLVPQVINQVIKKTNDPRDIDFDLQQMMRGMSGNHTLDISSMITTGETKRSLGSLLGKLFGK